MMVIPDQWGLLRVDEVKLLWPMMPLLWLAAEMCFSLVREILPLLPMECPDDE